MENKYPTLVEIKNKKEEMIYDGEKKLDKLKCIRIELEKLRNNNPDDLDKISSLEEQEYKISNEILKLDLGIKILDVLEYIIEDNIFEDYWKIIEKKVSYEKLLEIIVNNSLNIKKVCYELYKIADINDKNILKKIQNIPDEDYNCIDKKENYKNKFLDKIIARVSKLKDINKE